jgi:ankyrin repeat protein
MSRPRVHLLLLSILLTSRPGGANLHAAVEQNNATQIRSLLAEGALPVDALDDNNMTPLILASYYGHEESVAELTSGGASVDAESSEGMTALAWASSLGFAEVIDLLLAAGSTVDRPDDGGRTPLMYAAVRGHAEAVVKLVKAGAALEAQSHRKVTALQMAAEAGETDTIRQLVRAGARIEANGDELGIRPLHAAAAIGHLDAVRVLLEAGANIEARDGKGRTPHKLAVIMKKKACAAALRAAAHARSSPSEHLPRRAARWATSAIGRLAARARTLVERAMRSSPWGGGRKRTRSRAEEKGLEL